MIRLNDEKCCELCWHGPDRPCPDVICCNTLGRSCHDSPACAAKRRDWLARVRRDVLERPAIFVGTGTCGLGAGAGNVLRAVRRHLQARRLDADVIEIGCIGLCAAEPLMDVQLPGRTRLAFGSVTPEMVTGILDDVMTGRVRTDCVLGQFRPPVSADMAKVAEESRDCHAAQVPWPGAPFLDEHPFFAPQTRWVLANCGIIDPARIEEYIARDGYKAFTEAISRRTPQELCEEVEASGLRGRGGGGFPTGTKWKLAMHAHGDQKYLICNADEGDPGAFMDRAIVEGDPHRVLEGIAIAAYAIGASKAYVYIRAEYPLAVKRIAQAIAQAQGCGLLGHNILDSGFSLEVRLKQGAGAFVCGEETALIHSLEGKRGMPRPRPPFPTTRGLFGRPTVINNVETLANLPAIIDRGARWFSALGTATSKGTKVFALSGKVNRTGLVEVAMGTPMRQIIMDIGGGIPHGKAYKAAQIGGPSGGCIPSECLDIQVDYESLKGVGAIMGSGGLVVMDEDTCMVDIAKYFMDFIQRESCGKCIPCREGTRRMLEILARITRGRGGEEGTDSLERFKGVMYLQRLAEVIKDTSLCGLGQTAPNPVLSTLRWFRQEYEAHIYERRCPARVCAELLNYSIDAGACKGCTLCAKKCPAGAILGAPKSPHYVIPDKCIRCDTCRAACKFGAISVH